jgi:hypothetical protein
MQALFCGHCLFEHVQTNWAPNREKNIKYQKSQTDAMSEKKFEEKNQNNNLH